MCDNKLASSHVSDCLISFDVVLEISRGITRDESQSLDPSLVADELRRFRIWVEDIGAHRKGLHSLEYRLRDASHLRAKVETLLNELDRTLQRSKYSNHQTHH